jgi:lipopolysaccharide/colanic/teichoic acid biosynthesis glycosyltransferase
MCWGGEVRRMTQVAIQLQAQAQPRPRRMPRCPAGAGFELFQRTLDIAGATWGLLLVWPLLLACAAWIKLSDGGPAFYRQWRVGRDGWLFRLYKLRTMGCDAERRVGAQYASAGDKRVLPGCAWMRKSHVDELPQLWNILMGQMSLVGPRPERPEMLEALRPQLPGIERRLAVRPGLTGLAQIRHGYTSDVDGARRKLACDLRYMRRRTVWNELRLVLATLPKVWDRGAW